MSLSDRYDLDKLINHSAEVVYDRIESVLDERDDICHCEECVLDLVAYTLNHVKPLYGTSLLGQLHPSAEKQRKMDEKISRSIIEGLKRIARHPHHEDRAEDRAENRAEYRA
jgi:competence protein ComFB